MFVVQKKREREKVGVRTCVRVKERGKAGICFCLQTTFGSTSASDYLHEQIKRILTWANSSAKTFYLFAYSERKYRYTNFYCLCMPPIFAIRT